jgi:hypothetical protein
MKKFKLMKLTDFTYPEIKEQIEKYFNYDNDFEISLFIKDINPDFDKNTINISIEYPNNEISSFNLLFTKNEINIYNLSYSTTMTDLNKFQLGNVVNDTINDLSKEIYGKTKGKSMYFSETKMKRK